MKIKKPKFWDYKKPNFLAYLFFPISYVLQLFNFLKIKVTPVNKYLQQKRVAASPQLPFVLNICIKGNTETPWKYGMPQGRAKVFPRNMVRFQE